MCHPERNWRFDFDWPSLKIAVEIHGGTRGRAIHCHQCGAKVRMPKRNGQPGKVAMFGGRHNNPSGFDGDCEKENAAVSGGWRVLKFTTGQLDVKPAQCVQEVIEMVVATADQN